MLRAVAGHTTGCAGMTMLDKIVYLADAVSEDRDYPGVDEMRALAERSPDAAMLAILRDIMVTTVKKGKPLVRESLEAYNELLIP